MSGSLVFRGESKIKKMTNIILLPHSNSIQVYIYSAALKFPRNSLVSLSEMC
jgi:hypothetical protein